MARMDVPVVTGLPGMFGYYFDSVSEIIEAAR